MAELFTQDEFNGGAWSETLAGGKGFGVLRIVDGQLQFTSDKGQVTFPLSGMIVKLGGAANRVLFFTHPEKEGWTLQTSDHGILKHPSMQGFAELTEQVRGVRRNKLIAFSVLAALGLMVLGSLGCLWIFRSTLVRGVARQVPVEWEHEMASAAFTQIKTQSPPISSPQIDEQLQALVAPLVKGVGSERYRFEFHIVKNDDINAFAMPGGIVVLHSGLLLKADTPEEVLGVLGHEIAHVTEQHSVRNIISAGSLYLVVSSVMGDLSGLQVLLLDGAQSLLRLRFSRDFEREADEIGWRFLVQSEIDPSGMRAFFERLEEEEKKRNLGRLSEALSLLSTHPATPERIARMKAKDESLSKTKNFGKVEFDFRKFQADVKAYLARNP